MASRVASENFVSDKFTILKKELGDEIKERVQQNL